eukprot:CAMPEP_0206002130 /NCGR_PEP_ID=MMETSP1464-20131121/2556_1 /ASSEMBLY_ACC=CAM_ASM_001124 /TAXON_ID=119497 /ORGANISM="Exanthemachrysis gayraliae, Strain RCC1523" /LENGTH=143 /DNA_ID=CAMNT_0053375465 /DNA_START=354 /DNA_END=785 /DNA_ORIENTATION=+
MPGTEGFCEDKGGTVSAIWAPTQARGPEPKDMPRTAARPLAHRDGSKSSGDGHSSVSSSKDLRADHDSRARANGHLLLIQALEAHLPLAHAKEQRSRWVEAHRLLHALGEERGGPLRIGCDRRGFLASRAEGVAMSLDEHQGR